MMSEKSQLERQVTIKLLATLMLLLSASGVLGAPCPAEDFETRVSGESECLLMRRYGSSTPDTLIVWLHGNVSTGGPANSHFRIAEKLAQDFSRENVLAVALVRPGYPDGSGESSSGNDYGRTDNWPLATVAEIGTVIERLRARFKPRAVVVVGHSGGAAIAAVLLGLQPQLAEAALLLACPCDMVAWRTGRSRRPWSSEDPMRWVGNTRSSVKVIAMTGSMDGTTTPELGRNYVDRLKARGVAADFVLVPEAGHIDLIRWPVVSGATGSLLHRPPE